MYLMENNTNYWIFFKFFSSKIHHIIHSSTNKTPFEFMFNRANNRYYAADSAKILELILDNVPSIDKIAANMVF
jgi:hypothetical protein